MAIYYLFSVKLFSDYNYNITTLKKKLKKICGRVCDCVYLITLKRNVVHIYTNVYETSIAKEVMVDTQKKKR